MLKTYKHLFGPVPSRRLGLSLGVDLLLPKTCSLDCVYCESGITTSLTLNRYEYVASDQVEIELNDFLSAHPRLDYVTFSGWGEPVLNSGMPRIVRFIKMHFPQYKIALLTNGTLFYMEQARADVLDIDLIVASLDAVSDDVFQALNRPHSALEPERIIQGLIDLRKEFRNELWLEIFIVPGLNDTDSELRKLSDAAIQIGADKIQINTLDRPGTESWVKPCEKCDFERIQRYFDNLEIVKGDASVGKDIPCALSDIDFSILQLIRRRPCTREDMVKSTGHSKERVEESLKRLLSEGKIHSEKMMRGDFYRIS